MNLDFLKGRPGARKNAKDSAAGPQTGNPPSPSGVQTPSGDMNIKPKGDELATRIKKTPLYVAMAVLGIGAYGTYEYFQHSDYFSHTSHHQSQKIGPAKEGNVTVPKPKPEAKKPVEPKSTVTAKTESPAPATASTPATAPAASGPVKNPYAAQDAAFAAALGGGSGGSGGGLAWSQQQSAPSGEQPSTQAPTALPVVADSQGTKPAKKKLPPSLVTRETSPYELLQGAVIPAVLQVGIKSYLPGQIMAVVSHNVYSSVNGATLLIPAGAKLVGTYNTATAFGVNRLMVIWTRVEFPNGTYMDMPDSGAAGGSGYAGFAGEVNDHTWLIFKNALLLSLVDVGEAIASPTSSSSNTTGVTSNEALQDGEQSLAQTMGQAESQLLQKYINIAPTITIHPGYLFNVVVKKDMVFPGPYNPAMQTGSGAVQGAMAPKPNPYG